MPTVVEIKRRIKSLRSTNCKPYSHMRKQQLLALLNELESSRSSSTAVREIEKFIILDKKKTEEPVKGKQNKPILPKKKAPVRPVAYLKADMKRELIKLLDKVFYRVAYYFASNDWFYKRNMIQFTNKYVKRIKKKYVNLKTEEKDELVKNTLSKLKTLDKNQALNEKYKTSKIAYEKIIKFMDNRYPE